MVTVAEALNAGTQHHQAGRLAEAERIYRQILAVEPHHPDALHLLGMLAMQARQFEAAVELIRQAIGIDGSQAAYYANLGEAYRHLGRIVDATTCMRAAVTIDPTLARSHSALGNLLRLQGKHAEAEASLGEALRLIPQDVTTLVRLGQVLMDQGRSAEAESYLHTAVRLEPDNSDAWFELATALQQQGRLDEAASGYQTALQHNPGLIGAHINLGTIRTAQNSPELAAAHYRAALQIDGSSAAAHHNLGAVHEDQGQLELAAGEYRLALECNPDFHVARNALGSVFQKQGKLDEAWVSFQEVLRRDPRDAVAHVNCGAVLHAQYKLAGAFDWYQKAIALDPQNACAHNNAAAALSEQGKRDEAIAFGRRAIELDPDAAMAHGTLAVALQALGRRDDAEAHHRRAVELNPRDAQLHSNLLYLLNYGPHFDAAAIFAEHRAWGARHADPLTAACLPHANDRTSGRRLRIGYISGHFMQHAVNFFSEPILASHDHARFEVYCYSNVQQDDSTSVRLRGYADHWRQIYGRSDQEVSRLVREDGIDILVDLAGHIGGNRLLVFAHKPAPVQIAYLGYQNTTGMLGMDYRLTDAYADPPGSTDAFYTEQLIRLPNTFFCYLPSIDAPPVVASPSVANGFVTFGSFNNFTKVTPLVLATWAKLLGRTPCSRLILLADMTDSLVDYLVTTFESEGISRDRLNLVNRRPRSQYLDLIQQADIALDPFPFNGHTTTCDALWQGVPVVTLSGEHYVSRFGGSGLATLGLDELIATTPAQYVDIAAALAEDVDRRRQLRSHLRAMMTASPLLDSATFTARLEAAYRQMWSDWCTR